MLSFQTKGSWANTFAFLRKTQTVKLSNLEKYAQQGVDALAAATPVDSGLTAQSWYYKIIEREGSITIEWLNRNVQDGVPIAVILQYGHGTGTGGYVEGVDYINPALKPLFDKIAHHAWEEVTR